MNLLTKLLPFQTHNWVTRLAPSPTGYLHSGHLLHLLYVSAISETLQAKVILRIENHDRQRCKAAYEAAILDDLEALGLDFGQTKVFREGPSDFRQSDCRPVYLSALDELRKNKAHLYYCDCSRKSILARIGQSEGELRYDGFCRNRNLNASPNLGLRLTLPDHEVRFDDLWHGQQVQFPASDTGDLLLHDRNGLFTYQFCVVVDDLRHGVNLVIRGLDILPSTGRQILMAEMLSGKAENFQYLHHPLITDQSGRKLSKRDFDYDLHEKIAQGKSAPKLFGEALLRAGMVDKPAEFNLAEARKILLELHFPTGNS